MLDEIPDAVLPKVDVPKGDDCGVVVVVVVGVCPNENANPPDPEAGVPFEVVVMVVVVATGVLDVLFTGNENLGVVEVLSLGALVVEANDVKIPFPNTPLLEASEDLLPNALPPNMFGV